MVHTTLRAIYILRSIFASDIMSQGRKKTPIVRDVVKLLSWCLVRVRRLSGCRYHRGDTQCCRKWPDQNYGKPFVPRARYLRLLRRRRRYEPQYHYVLRMCSEVRDSRSFLWLNIKKSIHGKSPCIKKMRRDQAGTPLSRVYTRISRLWRHKSIGEVRCSARRRCKHIFRIRLRQCAKG